MEHVYKNHNPLWKGLVPWIALNVTKSLGKKLKFKEDFDQRQENYILSKLLQMRENENTL
jgi:hypothetical protein